MLGTKFETDQDSIRDSYQDYNPSYRSPSFAEDHPRNRRRNDSRDSRRNSFRTVSELSQRTNSRISFYSKENSPRRKSSSPEDLRVRSSKKSKSEKKSNEKSKKKSDKKTDKKSGKKSDKKSEKKSEKIEEKSEPEEDEPKAKTGGFGITRHQVFKRCKGKATVMLMTL